VQKKVGVPDIITKKDPRSSPEGGKRMAGRVNGVNVEAAKKENRSATGEMSRRERLSTAFSRKRVEALVRMLSVRAAT